jgi:hypothetical protein
MLPMPGGAVFSAPLVKKAAQDLRLENFQKVFINYWFRHIWELTWPLYPGFILAAYLSNMNIMELISLTWPSLIFIIIIGWIFFLNPRKLPQLKKYKPEQKKDKNLGRAIRSAAPLIFAVLGTLLLEGLIWSLRLPLPSEIGFILALTGAISLAFKQSNLNFTTTIAFFYQKHVLQMLFTILSIFVFKGILDRGGVVEQLAANTGSSNALLATAMILPLLVGMISGITMAFVGSTFPLILGIMEHLEISCRDPYIILALFSGYAGVLGSPMHICFLLTCDYFQTNVTWAWARIFWPSLSFLGIGFLYFQLLLI